MAVRTERSEVRTETTEGQYSPVRLELARLVSILLYGIRAMLVLNLLAFENKKYTAYVRMAKSRPRKNQSERSDLLCHIIKWHIVFFFMESSSLYTEVRQNTNFHYRVHVLEKLLWNCRHYDTNQTLYESHIVPILQYTNCSIRSSARIVSLHCITC